MFKYVCHVDYAITNRDEMVAYMERSFGMRPDKLLEEQGAREAHYRVGPTLIRFAEPGLGRRYAQSFIEKNGPGLYRVSWGVDNLSQVAQQLKAKGIDLRDERGYHQAEQGFYQIDIDPKDSRGVSFRLVEEPK